MDNSAMYVSNGMISTAMPNTGLTARENMIFQEYLSNTAHQRQMADLKAAGLNPWLADVSGASTPSGSTDDASTLEALRGMSGSGSSAKKVADGTQFISDLAALVGGRKVGKVVGSGLKLLQDIWADNPDLQEASRVASAKSSGAYMQEYEKKHGYAPGEANKHIGENIKNNIGKLWDFITGIGK